MSEQSMRNPWLVVFGGFVGLMVGPGMVGSTFSIFFAAMLESFAENRAAMAFAYSLHFAIYGFCGPLVGRLCETIGPRRVFIIGALSISIGFAALGAVHKLWHFYALYAVLGIATAMTGMISVTVLISRWFAKKRGVALGVAFSGVGLAGFLLSPLCHFLIGSFGWRWAYLVLGGGLGTALLAIVLVTVRDRPTSVSRGAGRSADVPNAGSMEQGVEHVTKVAEPTLSGALRTPSFWLLAGAGLLFFGSVSSVVVHLVPLAMDGGMTGGGAALALGLMLGMGAVGKVLMGYLADRFEIRAVLIGAFVLQGASVLLVALTGSVSSIWVFAILFGIGQGGALTVPPLLATKLFGSSALGSIVGAYFLIGTMGSLIGPPIVGVIRDATGSYDIGLLGLGMALILAAFLIALIRIQLSGRVETSPVNR